ncbi:hypothetical protein AcW1_002836 [Taiwanofungus camphoratus]|nr:hypothetical protein AcW1_002836 [Antrodia cinnamomea]
MELWLFGDLYESSIAGRDELSSLQSHDRMTNRRPSDRIDDFLIRLFPHLPRCPDPVSLATPSDSRALSEMGISMVVVPSSPDQRPRDRRGSSKSITHSDNTGHRHQVWPPASCCSTIDTALAEFHGTRSLCMSQPGDAHRGFPVVRPGGLAAVSALGCGLDDI